MTLNEFLSEWESASPTLVVHTSGSTGKPKPMTVEKRRMEASARITCDFLGLQPGDTALLCMPLDFIAGKMVVVRSIVRRRESSEAPARQIAEFSGWRFNLANNRLTSPDGEEHALSTAESELLKVFINNPNRILQREKLMGTRDLAPTDRAIDVRISRLRRKLEPDAHSPAFIKTVYGAGYLFLATVTWSGDNA